jgi:hypothetical protein
VALHSRSPRHVDGRSVLAKASQRRRVWSFRCLAQSADGWDVLTPGDTVLKPKHERPCARLLVHLQASEPRFTRSQRGIATPKGVREVRVHAHDLMDGYAGREVIVDPATSSVGGFEVEQPRRTARHGTGYRPQLNIGVGGPHAGSQTFSTREEAAKHRTGESVVRGILGETCA